MNAKVGSNNKGLEQIMGKNGIGDMNKNGEMLVNFCASYDLVTGVTLFLHKRCHKITWVPPDHITENQLDQTVVSRKFRNL